MLWLEWIRTVYLHKFEIVSDDRHVLLGISFQVRVSVMSLLFQYCIS